MDTDTRNKLNSLIKQYGNIREQIGKLNMSGLDDSEWEVLSTTCLTGIATYLDLNTNNSKVKP